MVEERAARQGPAAMCGSGMFHSSHLAPRLERKYRILNRVPAGCGPAGRPGTRAVGTGSCLRQGPDAGQHHGRVPHGQKYCTYLTQGPMWWREGGNLTGVWCGRARASPNFFFLSTTFWWAGCSTIGSSLAVGYNRDYLFVPAIRSLALILWLRLFSNSSHCF